MVGNEIMIEGKESKGASPSIPGRRRIVNESFCERCGGLMVVDSCIDLLADAGEISCTVFRCVQCGNLLDRRILDNRERDQSKNRTRGAHTTDGQTVSTNLIKRSMP